MNAIPVDERTYERLRWRARRGLLELDLILGRFFDARLYSLDEWQLGQLDEVLRLDDNDFLDMVMGRKTCDDAKLRPMIDMIREA